MPGPLTYVAITLLARDRLAQIRDALDAKLATGGSVRDIDRQVRHLAHHAHRLLSGSGEATVPAPLRLYGPPLGDLVSKFALVGAVGPDLPRYAALSVPEQQWLADTLHRGTPDDQLQRVLAGSSRLPLAFWRRVQPLVRAEISDARIRDAALGGMQAYVLGHLCHVAADVVAAPYLADVSAHLGTPTTPRLDRRSVVGALEAAVAGDFFGRGSVTRGTDWAAWWPAEGSLPRSFYRAYAEAVEEVYGAGGRVRGLGAYEARRSSASPPDLSPALLQDGYHAFRNVVQVGTTWDLLDWMGATWWMFLPAVAAYPLAAALPAGRNRFRSTPPPGYDNDVGSYEIVVFPLAATALVPLLTTLAVNLSPVGARPNVVFGWVQSGLQVVAGVSFFATLGGAGAERWVPLFVLPLVLEVVFIAVVLATAGGEPQQVRLAAGAMIHVLVFGIFILMYAVLLHEGVEALVDEDGDRGTFAWQFLLWLLVVGALWMGVCLLMRYLFSGRVADDRADAFASRRDHHLLLFDDTELTRAPSVASPTLADLYYPSDRRELLKVWWTGDNAPTIRPLGDHLVFGFTGGATVTVHAPLARTTPAEYGALLERVVRDPGGHAGLRTRVVHPDDPALELPGGYAFADHGDEAATVADHDAGVATTRPLGTSESDAYVLRHAPRRHLGERFDRLGPSLDSEDRVAAVAGTGTVTSLPAPNADRLRVGGANPTPLSRIFRPGDVVEAPVGGARRVVVSVDSDTEMTVATPFPAPLAGVGFGRAAGDRTADSGALPGGVFEHATIANLLVGDPASLPVFGADFRPGDTVRITAGGVAQTRVVLRVISDTQMRISAPLAPGHVQGSAPAGAPFERVGRRSEHLYRFLSDPADTLETGEALMNEAADLAALLCLGATSHLLDRGLTDPAAVGTTHAVNRAYQVFRDWNLDLRRVNEWRMLVLGGAQSEKRGDPAAADPAAPVEPGWTLFSGAGEATANELGWTAVLRQWTDMARRPDIDSAADMAFRPGGPTNLALSRALAFLLDMRDPANP